MYGGIRGRARRDEPRGRRDRRAGARPGSDRIIPAFYFSTSGGTHLVGARRVAAVAPGSVPRLGRAIPYDYLSPHHVWPTTVLTAARIAAALAPARRARLRVVAQLVGPRAGGARADGERLEALRGPVDRGRSSSSARPTSTLRAMTLDDAARRARLRRRTSRVHGLGARARPGAAAGADRPGLADGAPHPPGAVRPLHVSLRARALDAAPARLQRRRRRRGRAERRAARRPARGRDEAPRARLAAAAAAGAAADARRWTPVARATGDFDGAATPGQLPRRRSSAAPPYGLVATRRRLPLASGCATGAARAPPGSSRPRRRSLEERAQALLALGARPVLGDRAGGLLGGEWGARELLRGAAALGARGEQLAATTPSTAASRSSATSCTRPMRSATSASKRSPVTN